MHIHLVTIFPEIFESFLSTSIVEKAIRSEKVQVTCHNPREYTTDKHQQVDDEIYGGGAGLLMKAQPIIDVLKSLETVIKKAKTKVVLVGPSQETFDQSIAHQWSEEYDSLVMICGRYEGIDHRVNLWCQEQYGDRFGLVSLGQFVTLGGELPAMVMIEAVVRLLPGVISDPESRKDESYRPEQEMNNLEYPQYTRPLIVEGYDVPEVLLSGHHRNIEEWRLESIISINM